METMPRHSVVDLSQGDPTAPAHRQEAVDRRPARRRWIFDEVGVVIGLAALICAVAIKDPRVLEVDSLINLVRQASYVGIMAGGMVFLLAMREIDLSVGASYALSIIGAATAMANGVDPWLAAIFGLGVGAGLGSVNGLLSNGLRVPTIVVTLGSLSMYRGLVVVWTDGAPITGLDRDHRFFTVMGGDWLGLPAGIWVFVATTVVGTFVLTRTRFGIMVRSVGSSPQVAEFSGIPVARIRLLALTLVGLLCAVAGMLTLAYFGSADPTLGTGIELQVIAAAIIGGTSLAGGNGTVIGAAVGALLMQFITTALVRFEVPANWSGFVTGAVIVIAVALDGLIRRQRARRSARRVAP